MTNLRSWFYQKGFLIAFSLFIFIGCKYSAVYKNKNGGVRKGRFCVDLPQPLLALNSLDFLDYYSITVQGDTIYIHNQYNESAIKLGGEKNYYVDLEKKQLVRLKKLNFFSDAIDPELIRPWDKVYGERKFFSVDSIEHIDVRKIIYKYEPLGVRGAKHNGHLTFYNKDDIEIANVLIPYYYQQEVESINTFEDKVIIIVADLFDHHQKFEFLGWLQPNGERVKRYTGNRHKHFLYVFNISDFIKPCKCSVNNSFEVNDGNKIPSCIPQLNKDVIGTVVDTISE